MIKCPWCGEVVDPCCYVTEIFYCPNCSGELSAEDVRMFEALLQLEQQTTRIGAFPKQKERLSPEEARERWRQEVARLLGVANWPEYTEEEKLEAESDTLLSRYNWPEEA